MDSKENEATAAKPKYKSTQWFMDDISFSSKYVVTLGYDASKHRINFLDNKKQIINNLESIQSLISPFSDEIVYLEWCDFANGGAYYYFDICKLMNPNQFNKNKICYIDISFIMNSKNKTQYSEFDESVSIETKLKKNDILLLSPMRSINEDYTLIGTYNNHKLFLGPLPTITFLHDCQCNVLFNCSNKPNEKKIMNTKISINTGNNDNDNDEKELEMKETLFKVPQWRWMDENTTKAKNAKYEMLDNHVDGIFNDLKNYNVLIHCMAGAHRAPFATGCFLAKYDANTVLRSVGNGKNDNKNNGNAMGNAKSDDNDNDNDDDKNDDDKNDDEKDKKVELITADIIYKYMKNKRGMVDPLSYGKAMDQYIEFINTYKD